MYVNSTKYTCVIYIHGTIPPGLVPRRVWTGLNGLVTYQSSPEPYMKGLVVLVCIHPLRMPLNLLNPQPLSRTSETIHNPLSTISNEAPALVNDKVSPKPLIETEK
jgi:hypothetical protein